MSADPVQDLRCDRSAFDRALDALGVRHKGKTATCPWHEDRNPSASIYEAKSGAWMLRCHGPCQRGGDVFDLRHTAGGPLPADQLRAIRAAAGSISHGHVSKTTSMETNMHMPPTPTKVYPDLDAISVMLGGGAGGVGSVGRIISSYEYIDPTTIAMQLVVFRILPHNGGKKTFRQASPCDGGWKLEAPPKPWPLYNRAAIIASDRVVVVEGEACVDVLEALGIAATTSPCGAGKAEHADWMPLSGKTVILWPDYDDVGADHMAEVRRILEALPNPPRLSIVHPGALGLPPKGDVVDFVASFGREHDKAGRTVAAVLDDSESLGASADVGRLLEDTIAGKRKAIAWPWPRLTDLARALLPGTVTLLCGDPGCGKSFMLLEAAAAWHHHGEHVALLELEEDRTYHLRRALAQRAGDSRLFDDSWIDGHPAETRAMFKEHRAFMDDFGSRVFDSPQPMRLEDVSAWIEARASSGARLIAVDPITAAAGTDKPWVDDLAFIMGAKAVARKTGASIVLVIHPKKGQRGKVLGLDDMAGSAAYQRFAQSVLWVEAFDPKEVNMGAHMATINRCVAILKARNGPGHNARIGFQFQGQTLRFAEVGLIMPEPKPEKATGRRHHLHEPQETEDRFKGAGQ